MLSKLLYVVVVVVVVVHLKREDKDILVLPCVFNIVDFIVALFLQNVRRVVGLVVLSRRTTRGLAVFSVLSFSRRSCPAGIFSEVPPSSPPRSSEFAERVAELCDPSTSLAFKTRLQ